MMAHIGRSTPALPTNAAARNDRGSSSARMTHSANRAPLFRAAKGVQGPARRTQPSRARIGSARWRRLSSSIAVTRSRRRRHSDSSKAGVRIR